MSQVSDMDLEDRDFLLLSPLPRDNGFNFNYLPTQPTIVDYTRGVEREIHVYLPQVKSKMLQFHR